MVIRKSLLTKSKAKFILVFTVIFFIVINPSLSYSQNNAEPQNTNFQLLQNKLTKHGFTLKLEIPPYKSKYGIRPYGLIESNNKTIWINPVVFDLGNAEHTLIHEAVHAAQLCKGNNERFVLLNLDIEAPKITHPYFMRYHNYQREIEAEAYTVQAQNNSFNMVNQLLSTHCSPHQ